MIVTIPAGREPTDTVLPGIREQWMDVVFAEMLESTVAESQIDLLKFRYTTEVIKRAIRAPTHTHTQEHQGGLQKVISRPVKNVIREAVYQLIHCRS